MAVLLTRATTVRRYVVLIAVVLLFLYILRTPTSSFSQSLFGVSPIFEGPEHLDKSAPPPPPKDKEFKEDNRNPRSRVSLQLQEYLKWDPPVDNEKHYPPYGEYRDRDFDPNRWEEFPQNNALYTDGTIKTLHSNEPLPRPYLPYPNYNSPDWLDQSEGDYVYCNGPRGVPFNNSRDDLVMAYMGKPQGFPNPDVGSWQAVGLDENVCFDRYGRLGPYGLEVDDKMLPDSAGGRRSPIDWSRVRWGQLQNQCVDRNQARYENANEPSLRPGKQSPETAGKPQEEKRQFSVRANFKPRTAILIRTWDDYKYEENDKQVIRSLVSELSLLSGGEYNVFLFVNVKDRSIPFFTDDQAYRNALEKYVPEEFRDIAILWSEEICEEWYPKVGEWSVYYQQFMPLQWFAETHPEFEYVWNWEMDARLIGQHYHFLEKMVDFSRKQPRKYLWERNSRYYLPAVHGDWQTYYNQTNDIVEEAKKKKSLTTVWGAQKWASEQTATGPKPPTSEDRDTFEWGVGEEADFITLLPLWDPRETFWSYRDKLYNYPWGEGSYDERPYPHVPRRVFINTLTRFSKKMLRAMHIENMAGFSMASEMWPGSIALQHGLKAVYAPHPIWIAQQWPAEYMDLVYNADGWGAGGRPGGTTDDGRGRAYSRELERKGQPQQGTGPNGEGLLGRWSQERDSPYSPDREHNFAAWSWYFWSDFPRVIYWRWLGWKAGFSIHTIHGTEVKDDLGVVGGGEFEQEHGRMCSPAMLLHPVKEARPPEEV